METIRAARAFDLQPTLTGQLVHLRPLCEEDFPRLYQCGSDPKIWEQHPQSNRHEPQIFRRFFDGAIKSKGALIVQDVESQNVIGSSRFYDCSGDEITIGYTFLATAYWGGLFNREMKQLMLNHAFQFVNLVKFEIGARLLHEGSLDGKPYVIYGISREDFQRDTRAGA